MKLRKTFMTLILLCFFSGSLIYAGLYNTSTHAKSIQSTSSSIVGQVHHRYSSWSRNVWQKRLHSLSSHEYSDPRQSRAVPLANKFPFRSGFTFPQPKVMKPISDIDRTRWIHELRLYLNSYNLTIPISLVTSNTKYTDVLLNWLISATVRSNIPLESILVISLDHKVHYLLSSKGIHSILVPTTSLFDRSANFSMEFEYVMMLRLSVMRIISHFGGDVIMYDTDAVILKNPQPLYDELPENDIIGSVGKIPFDLAAEWSITICIGVVLVKSSEKIELYWNSMKDICIESVDDQEKLNCGLKALDIRWFNNDSSQWNTTVCGITKNKLSVCILPYYDVCRQWACEAHMRDRYYVWHKGGQRTRKDKVMSARDGNTWFLKYKWEKVDNSYVGIKWLNSIAYQSIVNS